MMPSREAVRLRALSSARKQARGICSAGLDELKVVGIERGCASDMGEPAGPQEQIPPPYVRADESARPFNGLSE